MTLYARATAIGVASGLAAVIVGGVVLVSGGVAATGGGGIAGVSIGIPEAVVSALVVLVATGFVAGFTWTIWKARRRTNR